MNLFNRIVLVLVCLTLLVVAVATIVLTWTIPNRTINWLADAVQWIDDNDGEVERALLTTASAFVGLVATIVLLIELIPRRGPAVQVTDLTSGAATLSTAAIGQRIEEAVCQVPNVAEVRANVKSKRHGVLVDLDLHVEPEANLATVTDEACQVAQEVLTDRVHVTLLKPPTARLHYRELRLQGRGNATNGARHATVRSTVPLTPATEPFAPEMTPALSTAGAGFAVAGPPPAPETLTPALSQREREESDDLSQGEREERSDLPQEESEQAEDGSPLDAESATIGEDGGSSEASASLEDAEKST